MRKTTKTLKNIIKSRLFKEFSKKYKKSKLLQKTKNSKI
jgi:hypothetical protein